MILLWTSIALATPSWEPIGPQRGHVVDAAVSADSIFAATRVGVMRTNALTEVWARDPRFPEGTRRIAAWSEGAWASPPGQLWEINDTASRLVKSFEGGIAVDLAVSKTGRSYAAVRGPGERGVWAANPGENAVRLLDQVDPWVVTTRDTEVFVGTIKQGLWHSKDKGQNFKRVQKGGVTALGLVGDDIWAAFSDGRVDSIDHQKTVVQLVGGHVSSIAGVGPKKALVTVTSPRGQTGPLQLIDGSSIQAINELKVDDDVGYTSPTGAWSVDKNSALVGTFRRGPLHWNNGALSAARNDFRAFVSGGAAIDASGRLVIGGMGTGVYIWENGLFGPHLAGEGPVTDTVAIKRIGDTVTVVDFEGIVTLNTQGKWERIEGVPNVQRGKRNSLIDVGKDGEGNFWGIDGDQRLYLRENGQWTRCTSPKALRLDGDGAYLVVATSQGFLRPNCGQAIAAFDFNVSAQQSRAAGGWVATPGQLYGGGRLKADLPEGAVQAIARGPKGVLVAIANQPVQHCTKRCVDASAAPPSAVHAIGWLPNGEIWIMEKQGSLLVTSPNTANPGPWTRVLAQGKTQWSLTGLMNDPWMEHGPGKGPPPVMRAPHGSKKMPPPVPPNGTPPETLPAGDTTSTPWLWIVLALLAVGVIGFFVLRKRGEDPS